MYASETLTESLDDDCLHLHVRGSTKRSPKSSVRFGFMREYAVIIDVDEDDSWLCVSDGLLVSDFLARYNGTNRSGGKELRGSAVAFVVVVV